MLCLTLLSMTNDVLFFYHCYARDGYAIVAGILYKGKCHDLTYFKIMNLVKYH